MGRLHDRMAEDLRLRNFSPTTQRNYLFYARRFAAFFMRSPEELGEAEIRQFLLHQVEVKHLSYAAYRQIYAALKDAVPIVTASSNAARCRSPHRKRANNPTPHTGTPTKRQPILPSRHGMERVTPQTTNNETMPRFGAAGAGANDRSPDPSALATTHPA